MNTAKLGWYLRRLNAMSAAEVAWRLHDEVIRWSWIRRQIRPEQEIWKLPRRTSSRFDNILPPRASKEISPQAAQGLVDAANDLLRGSWELLGVRRGDVVDPDWFLDPVTGKRAPAKRYAFRINHRMESETGNVKQVWELSRHQHLTILAGAWLLTNDPTYAQAISRQLQSWWKKNTFLSGVHWTSGIEMGIRLISWAWIRRLLDGWEGVSALFEDNDLAVSQIYWHQVYLSSLRSRGSSANNHVIAEAAGQFVASCAFPWFRESLRWRKGAVDLLEDELHRNTFPSGLNREQAFEYHGFVAELGLAAAVEGAACGQPLSTQTWERLCAMVDAAAAVLDESLRAPRQGDGDDGHGVLLDPPGSNRWEALLATGACLFGPRPWWPAYQPGVMSALFGALAGSRHVVKGRPRRRPTHFADAGLTLLRTPAGAKPEIWCRCDGGPHGYLSIAAHAHADALSIEVRCGGVDILADPGTYCYHGETKWRRYFRSTLGHNTVELDGCDQAQSGGPFLWLSHANGSSVEVVKGSEGEPVGWSGQHRGYECLDPPARHRRSVHLDLLERRLDITDHIESTGSHLIRMALHLGPTVRAELLAARARLQWHGPTGPASADLGLAGELSWQMHRGETEPELGWYSVAFGVKEPTTTLLGSGRSLPGLTELRTTLAFGVDHASG